MNNVEVVYLQDTDLDQAANLASRLNLSVNFISHATAAILLVVTPEHLELRLNEANAPGPIYVDFLSGSVAHRHKFGGGRGQLIAKAVGLKKYPNPTVLDVTAGLGQDAFILATLGCQVTMIERSPIVAALLADGLRRAQQESWFQELSLVLIQDDALSYLKQFKCEQKPDVVYLDPMYPEMKKSALVKKEMQVLRRVVGSDDNAKELLAAALLFAKRRVVVKRPRLANTIEGPDPDLVLEGKSSRFDIYLIT